MKTKINFKKLSALFGLVRSGSRSITLENTDFSSKSRFTLSEDGDAFKAQFGSFESPDPETLPQPYDPQRDGN
ncbi:hypothetical protein [Mucilaginibacter pedocola]|uniref:Uncharacterized protein n=1 Tax=Mucilaginibacter pedocola TaxID=1792845 RepID=A0A1S9P8U8_9SPHI|nr:hypothetical protein [Mucilaginibacter pedocola]OOQ57396.1 hypothetical protein BC343_14955 [Mucilaginibacter pedocola]